MSMQTLDADGHHLEYRWIEPTAPDRPTLVFLHEGLGCIALWRTFPDQLAAATGCGALLYSRYGFGQSDPLLEPRPVEYMQHEARVALPAVLAARGIGNPVLVGHSDGATIALLHASDERWPVRAILLEAPHVFVEEMTIAGIDQAAEAYQTTELRAKLSRYHRDVDATFQGWAETWRRPEFRAWNIEACLADVHCPTLLIQGIDDQYGSTAQVEAIQRQVSGPIEVMLLPDCGHAPHVEQAEIVLAAMTRFIQAL
jgi:pimeloyl-ACP methyl ester carboxylesterase